MNKTLFVILTLVLFCLSMCTYSCLSVAQEEEELEYSWGIVASVSSTKIIITEYDYDSDKEVDVSYMIDPNVEFNNVESLQDIKEGDSVEIDYVVKGDNMVAKFITVEGPLLEEEYIPIEKYDEEIEYSPEEMQYE